jgi:preprotein translocase subunit SecA
MFASLPDNEPLSNSAMLTNKVTSVQKQVEGHNFDARKHVLEYDDVINKHRTIIYNKRNKILDAENIHEDVETMLSSQIKKIVFSETVKTSQEEIITKKHIIKKVNEFLGVEAIDDTIEYDDIENIDSLTNQS